MKTPKAVMFNGANAPAVCEFSQGRCLLDNAGAPYFRAVEGGFTQLAWGDFIVKDRAGEFFLYKPLAFWSAFGQWAYSLVFRAAFVQA